jgi:hypothetical protein
MTIQELDSKFTDIINDLQGGELGKIMFDIGAYARRWIYFRITETGLDSEGREYKSYSTKDMLVGCKTFRAKDCTSFFSSPSIEWKSLRKKGVQKPAKGEHNKKDDYWRLAVLKGGYKQLRDLSGKQSDHVDFFFSGRMWQDINIISTYDEANQGVVRIGARKEEEKVKLSGNTARRGEILKLSQPELRELSVIYNNKIADLFHKRGL